MRAGYFRLSLLLATGFAILVICFFRFAFQTNTQSNLPIVAIANYGPHSSLEAAISGLKEELALNGFIENKNVQYEIMDVSFDTLLIPQMIARLKQRNPAVIVPITTPVAQFAKQSIKNIPIVYNVITDPVSAGLIKKAELTHENITGSSDKQNLLVFLDFVKRLLPHAKTVGLLYSPAEANDVALVSMMKEAAGQANFQVIAIPIENTLDMVVRINGLKNKADCIYVGASGPILPSLPAIAKAADKMGIPVFSVEPDAVKQGLVLGSFGVDYHQVGKNAGKLIVGILEHKNIAELPPLYPKNQDHKGYISLKRAKALNIKLSDNLPNLTIVE